MVVRVRPMFDSGGSSRGAPPPQLLVKGLDWESSFRGRLQPDDQIVAVEGEFFASGWSAVPGAQDRGRNLEMAFGSLTHFAESAVQQPFTQEMKKELTELEAAKGKRARPIMEHFQSVTNDLSQDLAKGAGARSSG